MNRFAVLRPRRSLVLPLLMALFPILYFVYREASTACVSGRNCPEPVYAGYALPESQRATSSRSARATLLRKLSLSRPIEEWM